MKRFKAVFMAVLFMACFFCCSTNAESDIIRRIRNAGEIEWASEDYIVLDGQMIRVSDGEVLFDNVYSITSTGEYAWIETEYGRGIWIMDKAGKCHPLKAESEDECFAIGKCGLFYYEGNMTYNPGFVYAPTADKFVLPPEEGRSIAAVYQDSEGQVYVLTGTCGIYKANGEKIREEGECSIAINVNYDVMTNEYVTAFDRTGSAIILSPFTGEAIAEFPGYSWVSYDSNHMIFRDNTALIGPTNTFGTKVIGLDGTILKELPEGYRFCDAGEGGSLFGIGAGGMWDDGCYNVLMDRTYWYDGGDYLAPEYITCEETGEIFKGTKKDEEGRMLEYQSLKTGKIYSESEIYASGEPIPQRYEKYRPVEHRVCWLEWVERPQDEYDPEDPNLVNGWGIAITKPDGTLLGNQTWRGIAWNRESVAEDIGGYKIFDESSVCALADENKLYAVVNIEGDIILPSEYEKIDLIGSFSDNPKANGYCLAAKKNGQWYIFNIKGELLYDDADSQSKEEPVTVSGMPADQESDIPVLSEQFAGEKAGLRKLGGQEKVTLFAGPGNHYPVIRKINPNESNTTTVYFIEDDMVFVHYVHRFVDTYGYMKKGAFAVDVLTDVPEINKLKYISKKTKNEILPLTGPGEGFEKWTGSVIPEGSNVRCYFTEDGYSFIEYDSGSGIARVWVDSQMLSQKE